MASVGSLSVKLLADATGLTAGLSLASKAVGGFAAMTRNAFKGALVGSLFSAVVKNRIADTLIGASGLSKVFNLVGDAIDSFALKVFGYSKAHNEAVESNKKFIASLREEAATLNMTAAEAASFKVKSTGGSIGQRLDAATITSFMELEKSSNKAAEAIENTIKKLTEQRAKLGMTEAQVTQYELARLGALKAQRNMAAGLSREIVLHEKQDERTKLLQQMSGVVVPSASITGFGTQEAFKRISELGGGGKDNKQLKELEKLNQQIAELVKQGRIGTDIEVNF